MQRGHMGTRGHMGCVSQGPIPIHRRTLSFICSGLTAGPDRRAATARKGIVTVDDGDATR